MQRLSALHLADRPAENIDYAWLAEESELFSFAEIELVVVDAAREAARNHSAITQGILFKHVRKMKPALNEEKISDIIWNDIDHNP